jgi:hypothetical protein
VAPGAVPVRTADAVLLVALAVVVVAGFALIWAKGGIRALGGRIEAAPASADSGSVARAENRRLAPRGAKAGGQRRRQPVRDPGAAAAILISSCVLVLIVWGANPFAALLLVPALHLWMVALGPEPTIRPGVRMVLLALGFVLPALLIAYYAIVLGYGPIDLAWSGVLMVVGGQIGILEAVLLCLLMGCGVSAALNGVATSWASARVPRSPVTVRKPATYAGPGSLGGTASPLPRGRSSLRR